MQYPTELLKELYSLMMRIRLCEESLVEPILEGEVRTPCHLYSGQEAIAAGLCALLREKDYVFGIHGSHGHHLAMGCSMAEMAAEVFGCEGGSSRGRGGSMHLSAPNHEVSLTEFFSQGDFVQEHIKGRGLVIQVVENALDASEVNQLSFAWGAACDHPMWNPGGNRFTLHPLSWHLQERRLTL
ncbi:MAG: hypothetical protein EHM36_02865 [Deltaproteobacteria bacterium]|nr:MAG: hypothetical protein EHM36_02865 [Deltaproteobacteria bacterium]